MTIVGVSVGTGGGGRVGVEGCGLAVYVGVVLGLGISVGVVLIVGRTVDAEQPTSQRANKLKDIRLNPVTPGIANSYLITFRCRFC